MKKAKYSIRFFKSVDMGRLFRDIFSVKINSSGITVDHLFWLKEVRLERKTIENCALMLWERV
jgi:hypothetical protein